jgi:pSer/pThr/pTyr-binding forkhead associated (FHA) protein
MQTDILESRVIDIRKRKSGDDSDAISIGRSPLGDIVIANKLVSRTHAHLSFSPSSETCYLVDAGAANGTFVNGEKIPPQNKHQLTSNDEISFGPEIKFYYFSSEAFHSFLSKLQSSQTEVT